MPRRSSKPTSRRSTRGTSKSASSGRGRPPKRSAKVAKGRASKGKDSQSKPADVKAAKSSGRKSAGKKPRPSKSGGVGGRSETGSSRDQPQRLQRLLAAAGFGSRRQCETLIEEGRVEVDGAIVSKLGTTVDPQSSKVRVDGVPLRPQKLVYYAVNKPTGVLSTNSDPRGRNRVIDLVPNSERVFPVGRLDQSSQGLMLLTNDGDLAQQLAHPKYGVRKVYRVTVAGKIDSETMRNMRKGIYIAEGFVKVEGAKILKARARATELEITLREGKNREIRRILARLGHKVQVLRRIAIGPLRLGDVPAGAYRELTRDEVRRLRLAVEHSRKEMEEEVAGGKRVSGGRPGKKRPSKKKKAGRRPESRADVTARRTARSRKTSEFSFKPKRKKSDGGSIIGGE
ncbi:pseudouridine synthase [Roseiconus nitratireducens]|uniref:Pseudouridine synthase n=1 Tax=Roseiconus nitratireducens TaxID=2605748 RepID=A0A5M6DCY2_9BACT|nr:pseudouridine synthase [Roseiconus nitratireducens]KAA5544326.1 pseudouridine synthase [Roseiconus nitratireducens]